MKNKPNLVSERNQESTSVSSTEAIVRQEYYVKRKENEGAYCSECGKYAPNPYWLIFTDGTEAAFGSNCVKKYKQARLA